MEDDNVAAVTTPEQFKARIEKELAEKAAEEAVAADRTRLARDLHDAVTQTLFSASLVAEVLPDRVTILAQMAERAEEIDVARAEDEKKRAEARLAHRPSDTELEAARISMIKALVRLRVATRKSARV